MAVKVRAGDVFFTRGTSTLGKLIRWAERDPGEEPTFANHTGIVVKGGWLIPPDPTERRGLAETVEALWRVEHDRWWNRHKAEQGTEIDVFRHEGLLDAEIVHITRYALRAVGQRYGWWKLGAHLADRFLFDGDKKISRLLQIDKRPICSYLVARAFEVAGVEFGMPAQAASPDEMHDWCSTHEQWRRVGREVVLWAG